MSTTQDAYYTVPACRLEMGSKCQTGRVQCIFVARDWRWQSQGITAQKVAVMSGWKTLLLCSAPAEAHACRFNVVYEWIITFPAGPP